MSDARDPTCPKCSRAIERGFIADVGYGQVLQSNWTAGTPVRVHATEGHVPTWISFFLYRRA